MKYNDDQLLNIEGYENMARAYSNLLKKQGFIIIKADDTENKQLIENIFELFAKIKAYLFRLGGFLNTSRIYSLTDRQSKKIEIIFDKNLPTGIKINCHDKTKCFLNYLGFEFELIKNLIAIKEQSNFESDILKIINDRLSLLKNILQN